MIDGITSLSSPRYFSISYPSIRYINTGAAGSGALRYHNGRVEAYDGYNWISISDGMQSVGLTPEAEYILDWAKKKMEDEKLETEMLEKYPALKSAKGQYDMIKSICKAQEEVDKKNIL